MLSSSPVGTTQIVAVIVAVLFIIAVGDAATVNLVRRWMGLRPLQNPDGTPASNDVGKI